MNAIIVVDAVALTVFLGWYFFAPRASKRAVVDGDAQVQTITVRGGYSPSLVDVMQGVPVRLLFDRQETGDCSSRVVFPDFKVNQSLPAYATTAVEFVPHELGDFEFACGMNMAHGTVKVVAGSGSGPGTATVMAEPEPTAADAGRWTAAAEQRGEQEATEHAREIADCAAASCSTPDGRSIGPGGWRLSHRIAEVNSLITPGCVLRGRRRHRHADPARADFGDQGQGRSR